MGEYVYPPWAEGIGWTLTMTSILVVIGYAIIYVIRTPSGSLLEVSKPRGRGHSISVWVGMFTTPQQPWENMSTLLGLRVYAGLSQ